MTTWSKTEKASSQKDEVNNCSSNGKMAEAEHSDENSATEWGEIIFDGSYIYNQLQPSIVALKVLRELISESREYVEFDEDMKWGIHTLMGYCIGEQEKELEAFTDKYRDSEIGLIEHAEIAITMIKQGAWKQEVVQEHINDVVKKLDTIIQRNGKFKVSAEKMKNDFLNLLEQRRG